MGVDEIPIIFAKLRAAAQEMGVELSVDAPLATQAWALSELRIAALTAAQVIETTQFFPNTAAMLRNALERTKDA